MLANTAEFKYESFYPIYSPITETHPPKFSNPETEVIQWKLNDTEQILECKVKGAPAPTIRWKKNNRVSQ